MEICKAFVNRIDTIADLSKTITTVTHSVVKSSKPDQNPDSWTTLALEYLDQGVTVFDQNLKLVAWNSRVKELLGLPEKLIRHHTSIEDIFRYNAEREEYGEGEIEALVKERLALARTFQSHRLERARPDGTIIEVRGNPLPDGRGFVTTYTDITERKLTEQQLELRVERRTRALREESDAHRKTAQALHQNEIWIREITDAVPVLIAYVDSGLKYQFANRKHLEWFGLNPHKLIDSNIFDQVEKHNLSQFRRDTDAVLNGHLVNSEYELTGPAKKRLTVAITFVPHHDAQGRVKGFFFLGQDMSEYKLTQLQLAESHKMQALGQMTGGIAHDFNNLLTIILGNLSLLETPQVEPDEIIEIGQACRRAARRGSELIQRLLSFSRRQALNPGPTHINTLVRDITALLQRTLGENIQIITELAADIPIVLVDANQLETSLLNLVLNARDAMPGGGKLSISTRCEPTAADSSRENLILCVSDQGSGMSPEVIKRAYEPFYSTKPKGSGTGLGLSMVYGFVTQSGGDIEIHSRPGHGTKVVITLPANTQDATTPLQSPLPETPQNVSAHILLVEDDADVRAYLTRALKRLGYTLSVAVNGDQALEMLQQNTHYDLVLTDIVMPGKTNGIALAAIVGQTYPETCVLCMTGYSDQLEQDFDQDMLIRKPFGTSDLAMRIQQRLRPA